MENIENNFDEENDEDNLSPEDYAYPTVEYFEKMVGYTVNEAFRIGWQMARTKNRNLGIGIPNNQDS
jgi:hypothetical protein